MAQFPDAASTPHDFWTMPKRAPNERIVAAYGPKQPRRDAYGRAVDDFGRPIQDASQPQLPTWLQEFIDDAKKKMGETNAATEQRYGRAEQLLGLREGGPAFGSYGGGTATAVTPSTANQFGGASAPIYAPQTGAVKQNATSRGIYNTSTALNNESVTNSLALSDAENQAFNRQMQMRSADERMLDRQLNLLQSKDDVPPDMNTLYQLAAEYGRGDTSGLDEQAFVGGGGAGGAPVVMSPQSAGYQLPSVGFGGGAGYRYGATRAKPSNLETAAKIRDKQQLFNNRVRGTYGSSFPSAVSTSGGYGGASVAMPSINTSIRPVPGAGLASMPTPASNPFASFSNYVNSYYGGRPQPFTSIYQ